MSEADRWETLGHRWDQIRWSGAYPETRAEDVAEPTIQALEKVPDTIEALESLTRKVATAHEKRAEKAIAVVEFAFASPREPPDKMSPGHDALENAKECLGRSGPGKRGAAKTCEQVWNCRCDESICYTLEHTNAVELLWLHLRSKR